MDETILRIGPYCIDRNACLFKEFSLSGLNAVLAFVQVTFGQIPAIGVFHEKKLESLCIAKNQIPRRKNGGFGFVR
ncbi:MAG: hypothetical protein LW850_07030 [Planctomycetaceae bacterium]|nr:hypothetical protein [Planctomycetaceae bacterium]